ncbi:MAG TPA: metallophosphoesterase [Polyangiaceae bacterium]
MIDRRPSPRFARIALAAAFATSTACVRPGEERTERDLEVGRAEADGARATVANGLALVRDVSSRRLELWSGAPSLDVDVEFDAPLSEGFEVLVHNSMTDAEIEVDSVPEAGAIVATDADPDDPVTLKRARVRADGARSLRLRVGAPDRGVSGPFRFALLSDVQEAIDRVSDIFARINQEPDVRFVLGAGDLTEQGTAEQLERFQRALRNLHAPYYATLGNHELGTSPPPWHDYFGRANFHFEFRSVHFSLLDSGSATLDPLVYGWLDAWLGAARDRVHVVLMHIPPLDPMGVRNGAFADRGEAGKLLTLLANARVDLTLYGHIHSFYSFENAGIPARISGGGGAIPERFDGIGRHFLSIDADPALGIGDIRVVRVDE